MQGRYVALIPAYQPTIFLTDLVQELNSSGLLVVLVDDGSGEAYKTLFNRCAQYAKVLHHTENAGKGRALKTGLSYILENYGAEKIAVTVDADGQHRVEDAVALCRTAEENPGVLILGSRDLKRNVPLRSRFGNTVTRWIYRISTGLNVHDTQTGLRAFSISMVPILLSIPGERYEYEMNVLLYCAREKIKIKEQTIDTIYIDNNSASHFDTLRDSARIYREILKFSVSSLIGFLVDYGIYSLLLFMTGHLLLSNIGARVISASVNFTLNRRFVFKNKENIAKAAIKYFLLAVIILIGNTAVLELLVTFCGIHQMLAKIATETIFFLFSWIVQRLIIFRKRGVR
ncbi:MAG TPA: bifunctional glycosyltransferase family 2/GtrA family protein [Firmicutes bacterium]|nr:bifunctional glycosyltransferase family 2/GtrA family protein [Bacillota bacterium]